MTDHQEERLGMATKVKNFLAEHAAALSTVAQIATEQSLLDAQIELITDTEGEVGADNTGYTQDKKTKRDDLVKITKHVGAAAAAYFLSIGETGNLKLADYTQTELTHARDMVLYGRAKHLWKLADPVKASLTAFNSGTAEVDNLNTLKEAFFNVIQKPADKKDDRKMYTRKQKKNFVVLMEILGRLDVYMATFEFSNNDLFQIYKNRRMIDGSGSHGSVKLEVMMNIPANTTLNINTSSFATEEDDVVVMVVPATSPMLEIGYGPNTSTLAAPVHTVDAGTTLLETTVALNFSETGGSTFLNVRNPSASEGSFALRIRD